MNKRFLFLLGIIFLNSSCFLFFYKRQTFEKRVKKHAIDISNSDTSKINLNRVYLATSIAKFASAPPVYGFYKFFPNGRVYRSKYYSETRERNDAEILSDGNWFVYWIENNNIYIEQYNGYNGYVVYAGHFSENYKKIIFTDIRTPKNSINILFRNNIISKESEILTIEERSN